MNQIGIAKISLNREALADECDRTGKGLYVGEGNVPMP